MLYHFSPPSARSYLQFKSEIRLNTCVLHLNAPNNMAKGGAEASEPPDYSLKEVSKEF